MNITLEDLLPVPLKEQKISSELWEKKLLFSEGSRIQIRAPSAKGKTTFISILYGIRHDFTGQIYFNNQNSQSLGPAEWAKLRQQTFSIVFQDLRFFQTFTAYENILINAHLTKSADPDKIKHLARALGISEILRKKVMVLSRGEQQRVALIRALLQPFLWLLLDEPFSHLDKENRQKAINIIESECKSRKAGLIITSLEADNFFQYEQKVVM